MGANRSVEALLDDVRVAGERLDATWRAVPPNAWDAVTRDVAGRERPLSALPSRRWQELEVHAVDIRVGVSHDAWSPDFVAAWLPRLRLSLPERLPTGATPPKDLGFSNERDELAWLYGRLDRPDLPLLAPWR